MLPHQSRRGNYIHDPFKQMREIKKLRENEHHHHQHQFHSNVLQSNVATMIWLRKLCVWTEIFVGPNQSDQFLVMAQQWKIAQKHNFSSVAQIFDKTMKLFPLWQILSNLVALAPPASFLCITIGLFKHNWSCVVNIFLYFLLVFVSLFKLHGLKNLQNICSFKWKER